MCKCFFVCCFFVVYKLCDRFFLERVFLTSVVLFCSLETGHAALCEGCRKFFGFRMPNFFATQIFFSKNTEVLDSFAKNEARKP